MNVHVTDSAMPSAVQGSGAVIFDSTNAAIVIGIASAQRQGPSEPAEIVDAAAFHKWVISPNGGRVPAGSARLITSQQMRESRDLVAPSMGDVETAFGELFERRAPSTPGPRTVRNRLYVFVTGPGYGDQLKRLTLMTANENNELLAGLELTTIVNQLRDSRLFDEVIFFADIPRFVGHQGTSVQAKFRSSSDSPPAVPANHFYVYSMQQQAMPGSREFAEQQRQWFGPPATRLAPVLLAGLRGAARDAKGDVTAQSLSEYISQEFRAKETEDRLQVPEFEIGAGGEIIFLRSADSGDKIAASEAPSAGTASGILSTPEATVRPAQASPVQGGKLNVAREASEDELCLGVEEYAKVIGSLFSSPSASEGEFCFAVYGHWGRGKTVLMKRVARILAEKAHQYKAIFFSAWKYPTAPEVWVHLYEEFAKKAFDGPWYEALPNVIRTGIVKRGSWRLLFGYAFLALSVTPLGHVLEISANVAKILYGAFGVMGVIWIVTFARGVWRTNARLSATYLTPSRHAEKLGLQATIGSDLKALLRGWVSPAKPGPWFVGIYWAITAWLIRATIWRFEDGKVFSQWVNDHWGRYIVGSPDIVIQCLIVAALLGMAWLLMRFMRRGGSQPKKILLVVDDLDRCNPQHLLAVMESLKLLIEDPELSQRVQVAMLLEEDILKHAIYGKYGALADKDVGEKLQTSFTVDKLVLDNCEKLFTAHLRLPLLAKSELRELVETFAGRRRILEAERQELAKKVARLEEQINEAPSEVVVAGKRTKEIPGPMIRGDTPLSRTEEEKVYRQATSQEMQGERDQLGDRARNLQPELDDARTRKESLDARLPPRGVRTGIARKIERSRVLEEGEIDAVLEALDEATELRASLGPRTIRAFLFRYQLARLLLNEMQIPWESGQLARALADRMLKPEKVDVTRPIVNELPDDEKLRRVVGQVA